MIVREAKIADAPAIARVNLDTWRTAYRKFLPADYLAQLSYQKRESNWQEILSNVKNTGDFVCVAQNESGQIVGFAAGGCERTGKYAYQGELFAIYILEEYQRQGIGRQLVRAVAIKLADNSACRFYEFLGAEKVEEKQTSRAGAALKEIAYGWTDSAVLTNTPA
jgi:ribosomal protein S18 acetylase RimI-like enzyme